MSGVTSGATWATATEERLKRVLPGWACWSAVTLDRRTLWQAAPLDANGASLTAIFDSIPDADELIAAVRRFERRLPDHIRDLRETLAGQPDTGYGRDLAVVIEARIGALERLLAAQRAGQAPPQARES